MSSAQATPELTETTLMILNGIEEGRLREDCTHAIELALSAIHSIHRVHLPQDQFEEGAERSQTDMHYELAPYMLEAISHIHSLLAHLSRAFPAPASTAAKEQSDDDFDLEFDLVDGPIGESGALSQHENEDQNLTPRELVGDAAYAFGSMLRARLMEFGKRLNFAIQQDTSWPLLAELDDYNHKLLKAVQAVLFGVLGVFSGSASREEILPEYRSAVREAVDLRGAIADLTYQVNKFNAALAEAPEDETVPLVVAIADKLSRFAGRVEYRTLRAEDKKAVIDFRRTLWQSRRDREHQLSRLSLTRAVEGFSKFLESMSAINNREVLIVHDRERLQSCLLALDEVASLTETSPDEASRKLDGLVHELGAVQGRNPDLDAQRRDYMVNPPDASDTAAQCARWKMAVTMCLALVG